MKKETSSNSTSNLEAEVDKKAPAKSMGRTVVRYMISFFKKASAWTRAKVNAHFDRLISLRVYDQRRY